MTIFNNFKFKNVCSEVRIFLPYWYYSKNTYHTNWADIDMLIVTHTHTHAHTQAHADTYTCT